MIKSIIIDYNTYKIRIVVSNFYGNNVSYVLAIDTAAAGPSLDAAREMQQHLANSYAKWHVPCSLSCSRRHTPSGFGITNASRRIRQSYASGQRPLFHLSNCPAVHASSCQLPLDAFAH